VASGDTYTSWDDRDSAPQGEREFGYFGSSSGDERSQEDRDVPAFPRQRTPIDNAGLARDDSYRDSGFRSDSRSDSFQDSFHDLYRDDQGRRDSRSEIYGDAPRAGSYRDQTASQQLPPAPDVFKRGYNRGSGFKSLPGWARFLTALGVLLVALVVTHLVFFEAFSVQSSAMAPTLQAGDRVLVNKVVYDFRAPKRGEIVLFHGAAPRWTPDGSRDSQSGIFAGIGATIGSWVGVSTPSSDEFFRRVVAVPGDTIACCDMNGHVFVNGKPLDETYVHNDSPLDSSGKKDCSTRYFDPVVVSPGNVFVMGDNRVASEDSRCVSQVPTNMIVGRATAMVWNSWGPLTVPTTFDNVPKAYAGPDHKTSGGTGLVIGLPLLAAAGLRGALSRRRRDLAVVI
jgi:signal peptidase I